MLISTVVTWHPEGKRWHCGSPNQPLTPFHHAIRCIASSAMQLDHRAQDTGDAAKGALRRSLAGEFSEALTDSLGQGWDMSSVLGFCFFDLLWLNFPIKNAKKKKCSISIDKAQEIKIVWRPVTKEGLEEFLSATPFSPNSVIQNGGSYYFKSGGG